MIESLVHFLQINILPWGVLGVFVASVLEEVIAPIPSALIMTASGFLFITGPISWNAISVLIFKVAIPAALGVTLGSYTVYFVARFGGRFVLEKWGKYIGLYWSDIEKMQDKLSGTRKDEILIGAARIIPFIPSTAISAFCGIMEMNLLKYFVISFVGVFIRGIILGVLGWQVGNIYEKYAETISSIENFILISTILAALIFIMIKYKNRSR
ncbi:MAG: VTT domain-containing protein [Candidatus Zambryskibacteria bacterium]|nr:VTT domain-containing protein [Candidatus Zambryskibacteria bacterium]